MILQQRLQSEFNLGMGSYRSSLDIPLLAAIAVLMVIGLVMVSSASMEIADSLYEKPLYIIVKQLVFVLAGIGLMAGALILPVSVVHRFSWLSLFISMILLVVVLFAREINGSTRWIPLGIFNLQASEAAKLLIVIYMAAYLDRRLEEVRTRFSGFFKPLLILGSAACLLLLEPDLGSLVVLMSAAMGMIFLAGAKKVQFVGIAVVLLLLIALMIYIEPYRLARVTSFLEPWSEENRYGSGFQITQAQIAFGRGEWLGVGLGNSLMKLFYLPEAHTDFIFAILAEELGLLGAMLVLALTLFIAWRALHIGQRAEQKGMMFHGFLAYGIGLLYGTQALINMGVSTGLLPTKGLALPLISYGGSSLLITSVAFGLLLRIDYERRRVNVEQTEKKRGRKDG